MRKIYIVDELIVIMAKTLREICEKAEPFVRRGLTMAIEDTAKAVFSYSRKGLNCELDSEYDQIRDNILNSQVPCPENGKPESALKNLLPKMDYDLAGYIDTRLRFIAEYLAEQGLYPVDSFKDFVDKSEEELGLYNIEVE